LFRQLRLDPLHDRVIRRGADRLGELRAKVAGEAHAVDDDVGDLPGSAVSGETVVDRQLVTALPEEHGLHDSPPRVDRLRAVCRGAPRKRSTSRSYERSKSWAKRPTNRSRCSGVRLAQWDPRDSRAIARKSNDSCMIFATRSRRSRSLLGPWR